MFWVFDFLLVTVMEAISCYWHIPLSLKKRAPFIEPFSYVLSNLVRSEE